jgi:hypothetical protein
VSAIYARILFDVVDNFSKLFKATLLPLSYRVSALLCGQILAYGKEIQLSLFRRKWFSHVVYVTTLRGFSPQAG